MGLPLIVIAGATASGKSARALDLAVRSDGVVINADASQLYADLRILTARPAPADEAAAPHRLYGIVDAGDACSAARWAARATAEIDAAHAAGRLPILTGGTGLYLQTLLDGVAPVPPVPDNIRSTVRALDPETLTAALAVEDPAMAARLHPNDRQRRARALEVVRATGRSLLDWQAEPGTGLAAHLDVHAFVLDVPRAELHARADARFDAMLAAGALDEVRALAARRLDPALPAMKAIGVPPLLAHLAGDMPLADARIRAILDTRQYIKRQDTWFRNRVPNWKRLSGDMKISL
jgi:tRNA dimethylallyltransferase